MNFLSKITGSFSTPSAGNPTVAMVVPKGTDTDILPDHKHVLSLRDVKMNAPVQNNVPNSEEKHG